jgi:two-component sensor histidine kinase
MSAFPSLGGTDQVLITEELRRRPARRPDHAAELQAMNELALALVDCDDPEALYRKFAEIALNLCRAGSAGVSLLEVAESGAVFRWVALAGRFALYVGGQTPRHFSPCGLCIDDGGTILLALPGRLFPYLDEVEPPILEGLIVPLFATEGVPLGTIWIVMHDRSRQLDAEDARVLEGLGRFLGIAARKIGLLKERQLLLQELAHRNKNSLQMIIGLLRLQRRQAEDAVARATLDTAIGRIEALIHAQLHNPADGRQGTTWLGPVLHEMCQDLRHAVGASEVDFEVSISEEPELTAEQVSLLSLMLNELLTNALKHAFVGRAHGRVRIGMRMNEHGALVLSVGDDGVPFSDPVDVLRARSTGFSLIEALATQLQGRVAYPSDGSKTFNILIPVKRNGAADAPS